MAITITNNNIQWGPPSYFKLKSADGSATEVGATVEGVTIFYSREIAEVTCSERFSPFLAFQGMERAEIRIRVRENSVRNFAIAAGVDYDDAEGGLTISGAGAPAEGINGTYQAVVVGGRTGVAEEFSGTIQRLNRTSATSLDQIEFYRGVVIPNYECKYAQDFTEHDITMLLLPNTSVLHVNDNGTTITYADVLFYLARETV